MSYNKKTMYAMSLAEDARKHCEKNDIIERKKMILDLKDLKNILNFYGGKLEKNDKNENSIIKIENEEYDFIIHYAIEKISETKTKVDKIQILTGLAQMFLAAETIKSNEKQSIKNLSIELASLQPETFARAFIMPNDLFLKQMIENTNNSVINTNGIAEAFEIDYMEVIARGNELKLFK